MSDAHRPSPTDALSRRESLRLGAMLALGAGLGVPLRLGTAESQLQLKLYWNNGREAGLLQQIELTERLGALLGENPQMVELKWYQVFEQKPIELGSQRLPDTVQGKYRR